jgi:alpha-ketoglutarate-dependent taurine dioxygenase
MPVHVRPLTPVLGGEIVDLDLRQPISAETAREIRAAWLRYQVLVFRGQDIGIDDQRRLVACFGELQGPRSKLPRLNPDILYVANVSVDGERGELPEGDMQFHADQCYYETPTGGAVLYAIEIPRTGGNTLFASMYAAYETLPPGLRARLAERDVLFAYDYEKNAYKRARLDERAPRFAHPAIIAHPKTQRPVLFVNRLMAESVVGLPAGESEALLGELFAHIENPAHIYEHVWRKGDVVVWDNFSVLHARTDFDPAERRILRRMAIRGSRPHRFRQDVAVAAAQSR